MNIINRLGKRLGEEAEEAWVAEGVENHIEFVKGSSGGCSKKIMVVKT